MERLQKVMARAGIASRRQCEKMIAGGLVKIDGEVVTALGSRVDPARQKIEVAGKAISLQPPACYILLHKPAGFVTTLRDPQGRKKVTDLLRGVKTRVYPVGRLDYMTCGLLLLTNDGELANALTHPRYHVPKTYLAFVKGVPEPAAITRMEKGLILEDGLTAPAKVSLKGEKGGNALLEITVYEGRNRLVRRMCENIGRPVLKLKRTRLGPLDLSGLKPGQYRFLSFNEVREIKKMVDL